MERGEGSGIVIRGGGSKIKRGVRLEGQRAGDH